jgi:hypothetical protein
MGDEQNPARIARDEPSLQLEAVEAWELDVLKLQSIIGRGGHYGHAPGIERQLGEDVAGCHVDCSEEKDARDCDVE